MLGLINTRAAWDDDDNSWNDNLRHELSRDIKVLNAPLQILSLINSESVINDLNLWFDSVFLNNLSGCLVFTSPACVKAFTDHLRYAQAKKALSFNPNSNPEKIISSISIGILDGKLKVAAIGTGTKKKLTELVVNNLFKFNGAAKIFSKKILCVEKNADAESFIQMYKNKFTDDNLLILEGEKNKTKLVGGLKKYARKVENLVLYRRKECSLPSLEKFYNCIFKKNKPSNDIIDFNKQVFVLLSSSSIAVLAKSEFKKQKVTLNTMIVLSHHDRIINIVKEDCRNLEFAKILSLSPKLIAEELKKYLP